MTPKVLVIDKLGKPLLPTHPARARKLLRNGKAKVVTVVPFTIQLLSKLELSCSISVVVNQESVSSSKAKEQAEAEIFLS
jgi:hypothetical protein